jgi:hypothetical protein
MPISPGPATNSGTAANAFEANRAQDPFEQGKETERTKGANGAQAARFETRVASDPGH